MVRNYERKNLIVKGSRLSTETAANIILLYIYGFPINGIGKYFEISEPAVHRLIRKFQLRLLQDRELLENCLNLQEAEENVRAYFSSTLDIILEDSPVHWSHIFDCLFVCGKKLVGNAHLLHTYVRNRGATDEENSDLGENLDDERLYHFRQDWCESCSNPLRSSFDIRILNLIVSTNIQRKYVTKNNIRLHFPTMLIRAMASILTTMSKESGAVGTTYKDMVKIMWEGGVPILCQRPL